MNGSTIAIASPTTGQHGEASTTLPLAPLAGYRAVGALLPAPAAEGYRRFQRFEPLLLVALVASDYVLRPGILWATILPIAQWLAGAATGY